MALRTWCAMVKAGELKAEELKAEELKAKVESMMIHAHYHLA